METRQADVMRIASSRAVDREHELAPITDLLRLRSGHDVSPFKSSMLRARIEERMRSRGVSTLRDYEDLLHVDDRELAQLHSKLVIGVTSFFRDPEAFEALGRELSTMIATRAASQALRAWVPGCSTGEEAYSIAILLREGFARASRPLAASIFGTDIDRAAIERARTALFGGEVRTAMTPERLADGFHETSGAYRIQTRLRALVVFAVHDVFADPPFAQVDLLSCRNLLVYLEPARQDWLLRLFHHALAPGGLLFLGPAESVGDDALFEVIDPCHKIYRRRPGTAQRPRLLTRRRLLDTDLVAAGAKHALVEGLVPPSVIVDAGGRIVHVHGRTRDFLELSSGPVSELDLHAMARPGIVEVLPSALAEAERCDREIVVPDVLVPGTPNTIIDLRVRRIVHPPELQGLFVVAFDRARFPDAATAELAALTEELQSTNEELEASREELQSANTELVVLDRELTRKVQELAELADDLENLLASADLAIVFVDTDLRIRRFTERAQAILPLIPSDVGRALADRLGPIDYPELVADAAAVLDTLVPHEVIAVDHVGARYRIRISPYRTADHGIGGLVLAFVNVTEGHT